MRPASSPHSLLWLAGGLAVLLVGLAALQWRWIGRWSAVEEVRLASALRSGAADLDRDLSTRLGAVEGAFAEAPADDAHAADTLAARLAAWRRATTDTALVRAVYWVEPGAAPRLARLDGDTLRGLAWPERLSPWHEPLRRLPASLLPAPGAAEARVVLGRSALPDLPPALLVPALPPPTDPSAPLRFVLVELDAGHLRDDLLPALVREHLVGSALYDVRVTGSDGVLYDSRPGAGAFETADLDAPLGPTLGDRVLALRVEAGTGQAELNVSERARGGAEGRWRLLARHRAGSIAAAAGALRLRQLGLAFGVLVVLGLAAALLVASARRQRALAQRQLDFVAGVSHELRTPLAVLHSAGENLADGVVTAPEAARRYGALVRDESQRLAAMVETVLAYAGADATGARRTRVPVADVVAEAVGQARPVLDEAGTTLAVDLADGLPDLDGDPAALATALRNLLGNAARHGGPSVRLDARRATLGRLPAVALAVSDDGPGLDPGERAAVFEPFVRGQRAMDNQTPGSGLGLALVRRVAEAHGGTVGLTDGPGATFTLTLPAAR